MTRITKRQYVCQDGPWTGQTVWLVSPLTLVLRVSGECGRYGPRCDGNVLR